LNHKTTWCVFFGLAFVVSFVCLYVWGFFVRFLFGFVVGFLVFVWVFLFFFLHSAAHLCRKSIHECHNMERFTSYSPWTRENDEVSGKTCKASMSCILNCVHRVHTTALFTACKDQWDTLTLDIHNIY